MEAAVASELPPVIVAVIAGAPAVDAPVFVAVAPAVASGIVAVWAGNIGVGSAVVVVDGIGLAVHPHSGVASHCAGRYGQGC